MRRLLSQHIVNFIAYYVNEGVVVIRLPMVVVIMRF